jgi:hypothetical protein
VAGALLSERVLDGRSELRNAHYAADVADAPVVLVATAGSAD